MRLLNASQLLASVGEVMERLEELYSSKGWMEVTLTGEIVSLPYPVLSVGGRVIRGPPIDDRRFRELKPIPNRKRFLSVDASLKVLFDCGSFKIIAVKTVAAMWRWRSLARRFTPRKRFAVVSKRVEAEELLLKAELEEAWRVAELLKEGDYCVLDRPLMAVPALKEETRKLMERFDKELSDRKVVVMGVCKASKMKLNTGEPLLGYLNYRGSLVLKGCAWWYYPLFKLQQYPSWYVGEPCAVKFDGEADHAFRVDVSRKALKEGDLEFFLGELALLQDAATPGYPHPIRGVHEEAKITRYEAEVDRALLLEQLKRKGLAERFLANVRAASFKEEALWGSMF